MSCDVFSGKPGAPNLSGEYRDWLSLNSAKHQRRSAGASSLRERAPTIRGKYLAPSRGRFRFRALKDDYEKMKTNTSQTKATPIAAPTLLMRATSKARKAALLLFSVAVLLTGATAVRGQSALDGFDPNANGSVRVAVVQPSGKILIGGDFTTVLGVARNRIARLNPDGTLDTLFDPNANGTVFAIAVLPDGKILAGGAFGNIGGQTRTGIARLDAATGLADSFSPNASATVNAIAVQVDGKILAGGAFINIGGQTRHFMARLDGITGLADSFNPNADNDVYSIVVQADGKVLAGGAFTNIGGLGRNFIARLDATTGAADSFDPNADAAPVNSIALQADGKIVVGGNFTIIGGQTRQSHRAARCDHRPG